MFTLIAMGTGAARAYSVVATLAPGIFPDAFRQHDGSVAVNFEAAAVITVLVLLGQVLELRARESTSGAIRVLRDLAAQESRLVAFDALPEPPVERNQVVMLGGSMQPYAWAINAPPGASIGRSPRAAANVSFCCFTTC